MESKTTSVRVTFFRKYIGIFGIKKPDKQVRAGNITGFITACYAIPDEK
jgi:hypothetical protein